MDNMQELWTPGCTSRWRLQSVTTRSVQEVFPRESYKRRKTGWLFWRGWNEETFGLLQWSFPATNKPSQDLAWHWAVHRRLRISLRKLHSGREQGHPRPWLGKACLPQRFYSIPKLNEILEAMSTTCFCHIDRFRDAVSLELQDVVKQARSDYWSVAICFAVRYMQSPRGVAMKLLKAKDKKEFTNIILSSRRSKAYRQTGITTVNLPGVLRAAESFCRRGQFQSFDALEDAIANCMTKFCEGTKDEHFSARQAALDLCNKRGVCGGLTKQRRPSHVRLGPGGKMRTAIRR